MTICGEQPECCLGQEVASLEEPEVAGTVWPVGVGLTSPPIPAKKTSWSASLRRVSTGASVGGISDGSRPSVCRWQQPARGCGRLEGREYTKGSTHTPCVLEWKGNIWYLDRACGGCAAQGRAIYYQWLVASEARILPAPGMPSTVMSLVVLRHTASRVIEIYGERAVVRAP